MKLSLSYGDIIESLTKKLGPDTEAVNSAKVKMMSDSCLYLYVLVYNEAVKKPAERVANRI